MPLAVAVRKTEPRSESAEMTTAAPLSRISEPSTFEGHQSPMMPVSNTAHR